MTDQPASLLLYLILIWSRNNVVGIATRYGLDGPGIEFRWGRDFSAPVQTGPGAHPASYTMGTGSFPGIKRQGRGFDHPNPIAPRLKKDSTLNGTQNARYKMTHAAKIPH
jgi:hypothetical protein